MAQTVASEVSIGSGSRDWRAVLLRDRARSLTLGSELVALLALLVLVLDTDLGGTQLAIGLAFWAVVALMTASLASRPGSASRGWGALVAGTFGVPAAGVDIARLVEGPSLLGLLGIVGGLACAWLLAWGSVALVRSARRWRKVLAIPVGFLIVQFVLLPFTMAAFGTHPPRLAFTAAPPAGAERVTFPASDGVTLAAWYTPSRNGAAVVLLPGAGGTKADTTSHAAVLARNGYGVLAIDPRGGGESGGHGMLWGWHGERDIAGAVTYLRGRSDVDPSKIGAVGLSMGGEEAITAEAADNRIAAVVAEGASVRVPGDRVWGEGGIGGVIEAAYYPIMWGLADLMTDPAPPVTLADAVRQLGSRRVLLIESNDVNDAAAGPVIRDAAPSSVELWEMPDTGHTQGLFTHPAEWESRVIGFLDANLGPRNCHCGG